MFPLIEECIAALTSQEQRSEGWRQRTRWHQHNSQKWPVRLCSAASLTSRLPPSVTTYISPPRSGRRHRLGRARHGSAYRGAGPPILREDVVVTGGSVV